MKIEFIEEKHVGECAALLMRAYNVEPWTCHWTTETTTRYLKEYMAHPRFVGFVGYEENKIIGAAFCHAKTWWTNDELVIEEFYLAPEFQRKGYGTCLLQHIEKYIVEKRLAGFTLLTNRFMPAVNFYEKNGFIKGEHVLFMYKVVQSERTVA